MFDFVKPQFAKMLCNVKLYEPAHEIMVLITLAVSEGSGEPAHPRSLARAFAVRSHKVEVDEGSD